jgi:hypothetical protein
LRFASLCRLDKREKMRKDDNIVNLENILVNNFLRESGRAKLDPIPIAPNVRNESADDFLCTPFAGDFGSSTIKRIRA